MKKILIFLSAFITLGLAGLGLGALLEAQQKEVAAEPVRVDEEEPSLALFVPTGSPVAYAFSPVRGFLVSYDQGASWQERPEGLPRKVVAPFASQAPRPLTCIGVDPLAPGRVAACTAEQLYLSEDYGSSWEGIPLGKPVPEVAYLTSVALSPFARNTILVGTSFSGLFETRDRGKTWREADSKLGALYRGAGFNEEISALAYHPLDPSQIYLACGFAQGIYRLDGDPPSWQRLEFPGDSRGEIVRQLRFKREGEKDWLLEIRCRTSLWEYSPAEGKWRLSETYNPSPPPQDPFKQERLRRAAGKYGIYLSSMHASGKELDGHLSFIAEQGMNSMVVDFKEDFGLVTYNTNLELPNKIGSVSRRINLEELLAKAHGQGLYVIGRIVVFKDRELYHYDRFRYAVWNAQSDSPWRYLVQVEGEDGGEPRTVQNEYWVDPYCPFVWQYNLEIARELQDRGVDEIQFDYIRFPSDGPTGLIRYRYKREGMSHIDALESFLAQARTAIHIPISTDLYGFNTWHRMGNWIGQSIETLADYVDVICPMFYPSHFPRDFLKEMEYLPRAKRLYQEGAQRAASIVDRRSLVRPYVQAFLIGGELAFSIPTYSQYLMNQIEGALESPASGFTLWNASNRYYMVKESLKPILARLGERGSVNP